MGKCVGITYNLKSDFPRGENAPPDADAEVDDQQTVDSIAGVLSSAGYKVRLFPHTPLLPHRLSTCRPDFVFNIAEGWCGRNRESLIPSLLELLDIPYTGSDSLSLGLSLDKSLAKRVLSSFGITTAPFVTIRREEELELHKFEFPVFVKPNSEGSSKGIRSSSRAENADQLREMVVWITSVYRQPALVEHFLTGREFTVGILGNEEPTVLPIMEVQHGQGERTPRHEFVYSFDVKKKNLERLICPAELSRTEEARIRTLALDVYRGLEFRDLARVDIKLDGDGEPHFLEANPLPGLSEVSLFPLQAKAAGIDFHQLVLTILRHALARCGGEDGE